MPSKDVPAVSRNRENPCDRWARSVRGLTEFRPRLISRAIVYSQIIITHHVSGNRNELSDVPVETLIRGIVLSAKQADGHGKT